MESTDHRTESSDEDLVRRVAQGDQAAFSRLYDQFSGTLLAVALRVLNDGAAAEDVLQEVFLQIWDRAASYDRVRGSPLGWAVVMTRNRAIDHMRARSRAQQVVEQAGTEVEAAVPAKPAEFDRVEHLRGAVAALSDEERTVIEMAFFAGLSQSEIAGHLQAPLGTVKARIRRGMLKLRDRLVRLR